MKLTRERIELLAKYISEGATFQVAADLSGISRRSIYHWKEKGKDAKTGIYAEFFSEINKAESILEKKLIKTIITAAEKDWRAGMSFLERRYPDRWGKVENINQKIKLEEIDKSGLEAELKKMKKDDILKLAGIYANFNEGKNITEPSH